MWQDWPWPRQARGRAGLPAARAFALAAFGPGAPGWPLPSLRGESGHTTEGRPVSVRTGWWGVAATGEAPVAFRVATLGPSAFLSPHVTRCFCRLPLCPLAGRGGLWKGAMACLCLEIILF